MDLNTEALREEVEALRKANKELEARLFLYVESGDAHIHRMMFRTYMIAALDRKETDSEWMKFLNTFSFNILPLSIKIYEWIDTFINRVSANEMKIELESVAVATYVDSHGESHGESHADSHAESETIRSLDLEFKPIRIELESWPSDDSVKTE